MFLLIAIQYTAQRAAALKILLNKKIATNRLDLSLNGNELRSCDVTYSFKKILRALARS